MDCSPPKLFRMNRFGPAWRVCGEPDQLGVSLPLANCTEAPKESVDGSVQAMVSACSSMNDVEMDMDMEVEQNFTFKTMIYKIRSSYYDF